MPHQPINSTHPLHQLLQHQLRSLFDAETQLNVLLPRMIEKTTDACLRHGLLTIRSGTMENISRIQNICHLLDTTPTGVVCKTMQDLIRKASATTQTAEQDLLTDRLLIAKARQIVHYEIASFDLACAFASSAGQQDACVMLAMLANRADYHNRLLEKISSGSPTEKEAAVACPRLPQRRKAKAAQAGKRPAATARKSV